MMDRDTMRGHLDALTMSLLQDVDRAKVMPFNPFKGTFDQFNRVAVMLDMESNLPHRRFSSQWNHKRK
jgi:hypothetical protein